MSRLPPWCVILYLACSGLSLQVQRPLVLQSQSEPAAPLKDLSVWFTGIKSWLPFDLFKIQGDGHPSIILICSLCLHPSCLPMCIGVHLLGKSQRANVKRCAVEDVEQQHYAEGQRPETVLWKNGELFECGLLILPVYQCQQLHSWWSQIRSPIILYCCTLHPLRVITQRCIRMFLSHYDLNFLSVTLIYLFWRWFCLHFRWQFSKCTQTQIKKTLLPVVISWLSNFLKLWFNCLETAWYTNVKCSGSSCLFPFLFI